MVSRATLESQTTLPSVPTARVGELRDAGGEGRLLGVREGGAIVGMGDGRPPEVRHRDHVHRLVAQQVEHSIVDELDRERVRIGFPDDRLDVAQEVEQEAGDVPGERDRHRDAPLVVRTGSLAQLRGVHGACSSAGRPMPPRTDSVRTMLLMASILQMTPDANKDSGLVIAPPRAWF
jgi:hypothetical protein